MGRLAAGTTAPSFSSWCEKALLPSGNSVTGLLVLLPEGWFQTIEGPAADIPPFLQALRHCSLLRSTTVLACQEDVRTRYFPHWSSAQAVVVRSNYAEIDADGLPKLIADTVVAMLKIGKKLTADRTSPASAAKLVASWEKHFADFMPSNERLAQLHELEGLPSLAEFLDIFESPVDVVVQSEEIWPPGCLLRRMWANKQRVDQGDPTMERMSMCASVGPPARRSVHLYMYLAFSCIMAAKSDAATV
jgi:hypothetical protein